MFGIAVAGAAEIDETELKAGVLNGEDLTELARSLMVHPADVVDKLEIMSTANPGDWPHYMVGPYKRQYKEGGFAERDRTARLFYLGMQGMSHAGYPITGIRLADDCLRVTIGNDCEPESNLDMEVAANDFYEHLSEGISGVTSQKSSRKLKKAFSAGRIGQVVSIRVNYDMLGEQNREMAACFLKAYARNLSDEKKHHDFVMRLGYSFLR